jgi:hypothetical protein
LAILLVFFAISVRDSDEASLGDALAAASDLSATYSEAVTSREDYFETAYSESANSVIGSGEGDPSTLLRIARWAVVWATASSSMVNLWLGMGPGYYSLALDGNYIRLLGETGLVGLFSFVWLGWSLFSSLASPKLRQLMLAFLVQLGTVALFIDIFVSLKTMCLFWMLVGALHRQDAQASLVDQSCMHSLPPIKSS